MSTTQADQTLDSEASLEASEILRVLEAAPLTKRQEKILRTIASKYYREGQCYARQTRIADAVGCAKSTLQLDLDELEARGLIRVQRRMGTSNITLLADGMIEALRRMRIDRQRARLERRGVKIASTSFSALPAPSIAPVVPPVSAAFPTSNRPKDAERPESQSTFLPISQISNTPSRAQAQEREGVHRDPDDVIKQNTIEAMVREGITSARAGLLARLFEPDRIIRNIQLGLHREKQNPPGYLAYLIQHDIAAAHVAAGSEAERVRASERVAQTSSPREQRLLPVLSPPLVTSGEPSPHDDAAAKFALLTPDERAEYEMLAEQEIRRRLASLGNFFDVRKPTIQAMMQAHAVQVFRTRYSTIRSG